MCVYVGVFRYACMDVGVFGDVDKGVWRVFAHIIVNFASNSSKDDNNLNMTKSTQNLL